MTSHLTMNPNWTDASYDICMTGPRGSHVRSYMSNYSVNKVDWAWFNSLLSQWYPIHVVEQEWEWHEQKESHSRWIWMNPWKCKFNRMRRTMLEKQDRTERKRNMACTSINVRRKKIRTVLTHAECRNGKEKRNASLMLENSGVSGFPRQILHSLKNGVRSRKGKSNRNMLNERKIQVGPSIYHIDRNIS